LFSLGRRQSGILRIAVDTRKTLRLAKLGRTTTLLRGQLLAVVLIGVLITVTTMSAFGGKADTKNYSGRGS
jgi:uncharacterized membrane protein affecting hemolysin expression